MRRSVLILSAVALITLMTATVFAQGLIIPERRRHQRFQQFEMKSISVKVSIDNQTAETVVEHVFYNPNNFVMEAQYIFILPENSVATGLSMWMNGKKTKGELLDKNRVRSIYEGIVRRMKDPALLEFAGRNMFRARIYPIQPRGTQKVEIRYHQQLPTSDGIVEYRYPLKAAKCMEREIDNFSMMIELKSKKKIKSVYCPTHKMDIDRKGDHRATAGYEKRNLNPTRDLQFFYTLSRKDFGLNLLTYRPDPDEDGYFMMLLAPKSDFRKKDIQPKDIIFVLDRSGSMDDDNKMKQAVDALKYGVRNLNREDRFNIITFATEERTFSNSLLAASDKNIKKAVKFLSRTEAAGGTNIFDALKTAEKMMPDDDDAYQVIVFLTDGLPTVGETDTKRILKMVSRQNSKNRRLFCFGLGFDVNTHLLDTLSNENSGASDYVKPKENIEVKVSSFFNKINYPVLTDIEVDVRRVDVNRMYPKSIPDLFKGSQLVLFGRYDGSGSTSVTLRGRMKNDKRKFVYDASFAGESDEHDFIAYLWASRRIGHLLDEIRLHGENNELVSEVKKLSKKFGIVTPYTSYLVTEDEEVPVRRRTGGRRIPPMSAQSRDKGQGRYDFAEAPSPGVVSGERAVRESQKMKERKEGNTIADDMVSESVKNIGSKTFTLKDGVWVDSEYNSKMKVHRIKFGSEEYFEFTRKQNKYSKYFSLGSRMIIVLEGKAWEIYE